jgi:hypothetical protein
MRNDTTESRDTVLNLLLCALTRLRGAVNVCHVVWCDGTYMGAGVMYLTTSGYERGT